jgi:hypothetical protein
VKRLYYSSITWAIRRIHEAKSRSDKSGIPLQDLIDQDRELRKKLLQQHKQQNQRREFINQWVVLGWAQV